MQKPINLKWNIQTNYNQLTKAEKKIADYVLVNQDLVIYMSITELANACHVGETSVYRFCRSLAFDGYQEFKMQLSLSLATHENRSDVPHEKISFEKELMLRHIEAIKESYQLLDQEAICRTVEMIELAEAIYFFGVGDSAQTAQEIWNKFIRITPKVKFISDAHMQTMTASLLGKKDLVFLVSYSGATKDTVNIAKIAKSVQAKVVCITRYQKSPLTVFTDEVLLCGSKESPIEGGSLTVKMSQLYLIDILYQTYYRCNQKQSIENQQKSSQAVVDKLY